jgi:hypothetical protein
VAVTLTNSLEGVTPSGTALTAGSGGNTGGASGNFLDTVNIGSGATLASDSAQAAHGGLSLKIATGATAAVSHCAWTTSLAGSAITLAYFRTYLFLSAIQSAGNFRLVSCLNFAGTIAGACVLRPTTGFISMQNSANTVITTSTTAAPTNAWFRIEGFLNSATGVCEHKIFLTMDSATPTETVTSTSGQSLGTDVSQFRFGQGGGTTANYGPMWYDDLGASDTAYVGPAVMPRIPQQLRQRVPALTPAAAHARATYGR